jgi:hypothetical protein
LGNALLKWLVINTHAPSLVLGNHDWVCQPIRVEDFSDEAGFEQSASRFTDGYAPLFRKVMKGLLDQLQRDKVP